MKRMLDVVSTYQYGVNEYVEYSAKGVGGEYFSMGYIKYISGMTFDVGENNFCDDCLRSV